MHSFFEDPFLSALMAFALFISVFIIVSMFDEIRKKIYRKKEFEERKLQQERKKEERLNNLQKEMDYLKFSISNPPKYEIGTVFKFPGSPFIIYKIIKRTPQYFNGIITGHDYHLMDQITNSDHLTVLGESSKEMLNIVQNFVVVKD